jgi:alcohol dehydrogenase (cytochrome c)
MSSTAPTGKLVSATQFARKVNWASGVDMASGRPIDTPMTTMVKKTEEMSDFVEVWPSAFGGKNWMPMSFDPKSGLVFLNSIDLGMKVKYVKQPRPSGPNWYLGLELGGFVAPEDGNRGALVAWDPVAGKAVWRVLNKSPFWAGVLSTDGGVVFTGSQNGLFLAFDAKTGRRLWSFQTGSGITGCRSPGRATDASTSPS